MGEQSYSWETKKLPVRYDDRAKDQSEVRNLFSTDCVSIIHGSLPSKTTSVAVRHKKINEIWYFITGQGEFWRNKVDDDEEEVVKICPGICLTIPANVNFQFRNTGKDPLTFLCVTTPPWSGDQDTVEAQQPPW